MLFWAKTSCFIEQVYHVIYTRVKSLPLSNIIIVLLPIVFIQLNCYKLAHLFLQCPLDQVTISLSQVSTSWCVPLSCTIPRYVLPFQEIIDWGRAALVVDERAVFQVRRLTQSAINCGVCCILTGSISSYVFI